METAETSTTQAQTTPSESTVPSTAQKLTPLQLNNIALDVKHTVLTPEYLERLMTGDNGPKT